MVLTATVIKFSQLSQPQVMARIGHQIIGLTIKGNQIQVRHLSTTYSAFQQASILPSNAHAVRMFDNAISLRYSQSSPVTSTSNTHNQELIETEAKSSTDNKRPLAVLLTWLAAKDKHIEKYRNLYLQRGFDVLTVETSPWDLLFPKNGARRIAQRCVRSLEQELTDYPSVILHAFSVGGYQFGEMLMEIEQREQEKKANVDKSVVPVSSRIKGVIFDSVVHLGGVANGVSRSISENPVMIKLLKSAINAHMILLRNYSTIFYEGASRAVWGNYLRVPALMLVSSADRIGTAKVNRKLSEVWKDLGIDVTYQCWEKSGHVQHLPKYPIEYQANIDAFLKKIQIDTNRVTY